MSPRRYGCHNRPPFRTVTPVQDGWWLDGTTRTPKLVAMPFRMNPACQYTHTELGQADVRCHECRHRATNIRQGLDAHQ